MFLYEIEENKLCLFNLACEIHQIVTLTQMLMLKTSFSGKITCISNSFCLLILFFPTFPHKDAIHDDQKMVHWWNKNRMYLQIELIAICVWIWQWNSLFCTLFTYLTRVKMHDSCPNETFPRCHNAFNRCQIQFQDNLQNTRSD